jgi:hypothetical protein
MASHNNSKKASKLWVYTVYVWYATEVSLGGEKPVFVLSLFVIIDMNFTKSIHEVSAH